MKTTQRGNLIDETDREILSLLKSDATISQVEMSKKLGITQPSVAARIRKLRERGVISHTVGVNIKEMGLTLVKIEIETKKSVEILDIFKKCPFFLNGFTMSGTDNVCMMFAGEDISSIESCIEGQLRNDERVSNVNMSIIISTVNDIVFPVNIIKDKNEDSPCHKKCNECTYYEVKRCLGCPCTIYYRGHLW